jgi:hypothetical protein
MTDKKEPIKLASSAEAEFTNKVCPHCNLNPIRGPLGCCLSCSDFRDRLAAMAMQALIPKRTYESDCNEKMAGEAYAIANAMMAEKRSRSPRGF